MWPEEELEDVVCDVTCAVVYRYWECVFSETFNISCVINPLPGNG
jgi:hypothetical protein